MGDTDRERTHLTGDLYWTNDYDQKWWVVGALLLLAVPPAGGFIIGWMLFGGLEKE